MPDFARTVDIHRKPGYDPVELLLDREIAMPKVRIAATLLKKIMGFRYYMNVIGLDTRVVRGTHGRLPANDDAGPVFLCSDARFARDRLAMTDVRDLLLEVMSP
jgi:hypothetical protein